MINRLKANRLIFNTSLIPIVDSVIQRITIAILSSIGQKMFSGGSEIIDLINNIKGT